MNATSELYAHELDEFEFQCWMINRTLFALQFAFRASSLVPLFDALLLSLFFQPGADSPGQPAHAQWKQVLLQPEAAFARGGDMHQRFVHFRRQPGAKLHTGSYRCPCARGCAGEEVQYGTRESPTSH